MDAGTFLPGIRTCRTTTVAWNCSKLTVFSSCVTIMTVQETAFIPTRRLLMKKYLCKFVVVLCIVLLLAGCGCRHEWLAATCTAPKTCQLCGEIQGEATGHIWEDATCILPEKCATCHETQGQPLSHNWEDATTEAPKTCLNCQATEGTKLQTDPRFTTAATKHLYGLWSCEVELTGELLGAPGYFDSLPCTLYYEFGNTGDLIATIELHDNLAFIEELKRMTTDFMYESLALEGITRDQANQVMEELYGMTVAEYVNSSVEAIDLDDIFSAFTSDMVYYVGQNGIYSCDSWLGEFEFSEYTLEDGVLIIAEDTLEEGGEPFRWTRVEEQE